MTRVAISDIKRVVARHFDVTIEQIDGPLKHSKFFEPRAVGYVLSAELSGASAKTIARNFGGRDYSVVRNGERWMRNDAPPEIKAALNQLREQLIAAAPHSRTMVWAAPFKSHRTGTSPAPAFIRSRR